MAAILAFPAAIAALVVIQGALRKRYRRHSKYYGFIGGALPQCCGTHVKRYGDKRDRANRRFPPFFEPSE